MKSRKIRSSSDEFIYLLKAEHISLTSQINAQVQVSSCSAVTVFTGNVDGCDRLKFK